MTKINITIPVDATSLSLSVVVGLFPSGALKRIVAALLTNLEIRKATYFQRKMSEYKTPHDIFVAETLEKVQEVLRVEADRAITQDSAIQALRDKMLADLPEMLLTALKDAAQRWATTQLHQLADVFRQIPMKSQG